MAAAAYHKLSIGEKQAYAREVAREQPVRCPTCEVALMPVDLLLHVAERCTGPREPGPGAKWVSGRDAIVRSVPKATLSYWVGRGFVRARGGRMDREYLLRDLALKIAQRLGFRRR